MRFAAAVTTAEGTEAAQELAAGVKGALDGSPDLALLFLTPDYLEELDTVIVAVREALGARVLIGCTCEGVIGGDRELEGVPGASLLAGQLPGVDLRPFAIGGEEWAGLLANEERLQQRVGAGESHRGQIVLGDPYTTPVDELLQSLDAVFPGLPTLGGMASGAGPGGSRLFLNDRLCADGAVGLGLGGNLRIDAVVSQGCRPIGRPLVVTRSEQQWILELARRPALEVAEELVRGLSEEEQALLENGIFVGVALDEYKERFDRGDFLVRNLFGVDRENSGLAIGDWVRPGQSIQFHVRDAATADEDLRLLLQPQTADAPPAAGLIFSCNGRGSRMFPEPDHDVRAVLDALPKTPLAGFFAAGELGPIGGRSFIHGHTASIAFFRPQ
jgi:small ligand-binding sensory domain FIST